MRKFQKKTSQHLSEQGLEELTKILPNIEEFCSIVNRHFELPFVLDVPQAGVTIVIDSRRKKKEVDYD